MSLLGPVAFLGLGHMGLGMAHTLLQAGFDLRVWNRTASKAEGLVEAGAAWAETPAEAARGAAAVVTMLADAAALRDVVEGPDGILGRLADGGVHVSCSTVGPDTARRLATSHRQWNEALVAAPVFGRPDAAAAAELVVCVSGDADACARARPITDAIGRRTDAFGADPGAALVVKLAGNFLIASAVEACGEALALAEKNGVDREQAMALYSETLFACPIYEGYGMRIARREYEPAAFAVPLGRKDVALARALGAESQVPLPLADLAHQRLTTALARGRGGHDWAALAEGARDDAGL